jgi:hypothetical protein
MLSSAVAERPIESAAAAFMKCGLTVPFALIWYGEHSEDGFQRVSEYSGGLWAILDECRQLGNLKSTWMVTAFIRDKPIPVVNAIACLHQPFR